MAPAVAGVAHARVARAQAARLLRRPGPAVVALLAPVALVARPPLRRAACGWVRSGRPALGRRTLRRSAFGIRAFRIRGRAAFRRRARRKPLGCPHE